MKAQQQASRRKNAIKKIQLIERLPTLHNLFKQLEDDDPLRKQVLTKDLKTRSSTVFSESQTTISKKKKITFSYDKSKQMLVTQIVLTEKTEYITDSDLDFQDAKLCHQNEISKEDKEKEIINKIKDVIEKLKNYCKYKQVPIPKQITVESMLAHSKVYSYMFETISSQFRIPELYSCSMDKLDSLLVQDSPKTALCDLILRPYKELLKQLINDNDILKGLFNLLRHPDFPVSKFTNKKKITFLMMLAEALCAKKKTNKKKKNKKKNGDATGDKVKEASDQQNKEIVQCYDQIYQRIQSLSNQKDKYQIPLSAQFIGNIQAQLRKILT